MILSPLAGKPAPQKILIDPSKLISAYFHGIPDPLIQEQKVQFGTSGHRGSSLNNSFNEHHILAITQAIVDYRKIHHIDGPLFLGIDTHALSQPAFESAMEVLAANQIAVFLSQDEPYTPTPAISHAILNHNRERKHSFADGIVITPSHNPPDEGGFKYDPPHGGGADTTATQWIEQQANRYLNLKLTGINRISFKKAMSAPTTHHHDYLHAYIRELDQVVDMSAIADSQIHLGVDPLGGAGVHYWQSIADRYHLNLNVVNPIVDPTFSFMTVDWDGKIRMDPSSPYAMQRLIGLKDKFDIAFACDTDHDRHGIVTKSSGLMPPNHYLSAAMYYLFQNRSQWNPKTGIGKTVVSSQIMDRIAAKLKRPLFDVPVGFKWFVEGLYNGTLGFCAEESAGGSFLRTNGTVWTTDKDGIILALLAAELTAKLGKDPGIVYQELSHELGNPVYERIEAPATYEQKELLKNLTPAQVQSKKLAGEPIINLLTKAPGNGAPIGGLKVATKNGWFTARPSGTEEIYKIYAESFVGQDHLHQILEEAQEIVSKALLPK
jgi:phosphoglucomutase